MSPLARQGGLAAIAEQHHDEQEQDRLHEPGGVALVRIQPQDRRRVDCRERRHLEP